MERRRYERINVQYEAKVTKQRSGEHALAIVSDVSPAGLSLSIPMQLAPGEDVQLEMADCVVTGRAVYCDPDASGFRAGIEIARIQVGATELAELLQRTLCDVSLEIPGLEPRTDSEAIHQ